MEKIGLSVTLAALMLLSTVLAVFADDGSSMREDHQHDDYALTR